MNRRHILQATIAAPVTALAVPPSAAPQIRQIDVPQCHQVFLWNEANWIMFATDIERIYIDPEDHLTMHYRDGNEGHFPASRWTVLSIQVDYLKQDASQPFKWITPRTIYNPRFLHPSVRERLVKA